MNMKSLSGFINKQLLIMITFMVSDEQAVSDKIRRETK